ncbi:MAG: putative transrane protein [Myxococcales bacterium]|nr:putative transrane protein [Myxococcales bacterium]
MSSKWLLSRRIDLAIFGGTAAIALVLVALGPYLGAGNDAPEWSWIAGVLLVDVAHVWSTAFVVYLDPAEWKRRPALYAGVPIAMFIGGVALYACGEGLFWRVIAYLAVFHFIRQQYGWVMMYRARNNERDRLGRWLDGATIYVATVYPLIWWHTQLPRAFSWMRDGDFITGLPDGFAVSARIVYVAMLGSYLMRAIAQVAMRRSISWGKHLIVVTTAVCWYVGIIGTNTDYAFTVTNVFIHGIPYMALVYVYARAAGRERESAAGPSARLLGHARGILVFLATLWFIAYVEEMFWDRTIWHDRSWLFGSGVDVGGGALIIAPLLAMPQLTHYVLDGFLWRRKTNPRLGRLL